MRFSSSDGVTKVLRYLCLLTAVSLVIGLFLVLGWSAWKRNDELPALPEATTAPAEPGKEAAAPAEPGKEAAAEAKLRHAWHQAMVKVPLPNKKGAFEATYPSKEWREVKYTTPPPRHPMLPRRPGARPLTVGGGFNISAQAPTGFISSATGSFDSVNKVTNLMGQAGGTGSPIANAYTLQLNTDTFTNGIQSMYPGALAGCQGWEQFIFESTSYDGGTTMISNVFIQYWLIGYGTSSPPPGDWFNQTGTTNWGKNSTNYSSPPAQLLSNLANLKLSGTVSKTGDQYAFSDGNTIYSAAGDNLVNAYAGWTIADFCIVGDGNGCQVKFNSGASIVTRTEIVSGSNAPPNCSTQGFTAETNNLSFSTTKPVASQPGPAIIVTESTTGGAPNCANVATVDNSTQDISTSTKVFLPTHFIYSANTNLYTGPIRITRHGTTTATTTPSPIIIIFTKLPSGVTVTNPTGKTANGFSYFQFPDGDTLDVGGTPLGLFISLRNPSRVNIYNSAAYTFQVIAGTFDSSQY